MNNPYTGEPFEEYRFQKRTALFQILSVQDELESCREAFSALPGPTDLE